LISFLEEKQQIYILDAIGTQDENFEAFSKTLTRIIDS